MIQIISCLSISISIAIHLLAIIWFNNHRLRYVPMMIGFVFPIIYLFLLYISPSDVGNLIYVAWAFIIGAVTIGTYIVMFIVTYLIKKEIIDPVVLKNNI